MIQRIIWETGLPRSGTTWLSQIFASSPATRVKFCPLFSYEFKDILNEQSGPREWRDFFEAVYRTPGEYLDQLHLIKENAIPRFIDKIDEPPFLVIKTNRYHHLTPTMLQKQPYVQVVVIIRNPCGAIHSWLTSPSEFPAGADPEKEWRTGQCRKGQVGEYWGFDDWKKTTALYLDLSDRFPERVMIIRYEDLVANTVETTQDIFQHCGIPIGQKTLDFIKASQATESENRRSVFKKPELRDRWKTEMNPAFVQVIQRELSGTPLELFLDDV